MKHPNQQIQKSQDEFLKNCPESERAFHARFFRFGNATYIYHQLAASTTSDELLKIYFKEWLEGLPENIRSGMEKQGFEICKTVLPYTRYVNERKDIGMDAWMREHLSQDDYNSYIKQKTQATEDNS